MKKILVLTVITVVLLCNVSAGSACIVNNQVKNQVNHHETAVSTLNIFIQFTPLIQNALNSLHEIECISILDIINMENVMDIELRIKGSNDTFLNSIDPFIPQT